MELAYAAHSARCALLLDAEGICRWFLLKVEDESVSATAQRCIGAQFVATLDPDAPGLLGPEPAVGKSILFARLDDGRVSLVRFGPLVQFDTLGPSLRAAAEREAPPVSLSRPVIVEPAVAVAEPEVTLAAPVVEVPRLALVPTPPTSEPSTLPSASAPLPSDGDNIETAAFSRAMVVRASRRGMLPRRG